MQKDYIFIISEKNNYDTQRRISKFIKNNKKNYPYVKRLNIGNYSIYRLYKTNEKYNEHRTYTTTDNREYFMEIDFSDFSLFGIEIIKDIIDNTDFDSLPEKDKIILEERFSYSDVENMIYYDKKIKKLFLGKFDELSKIYTLTDNKGMIITNSEVLREELNDFYEEKQILNGQNTLYEVEKNGSLIRYDLVEGKEEKAIEKEEITPTQIDLTKTSPTTNSTILSLLKKGEFLTDRVYSLNPSIERNEEIEELEKNLMIPKKGVLLVGKSGVGKTAIVEGLAYKIRSNEVCNRLKNKKIFSISIPSLIAGTKFRGDLEEKIEKLCDYLKGHPEIILFLDEIHAGINDNNYESSSVGIGDILKPYISRGDLKVIGITTDEELEELKKDDAFLRRFNILEIKELEKKKLIRILMEHIYFNEFEIDINMNEEEIQKLCNIIIKLSNRKQKFIYKERCNPDSSINIIDNCFAYLAMNNKNSAEYRDFIEGILKNKNLSITEFDMPMLGIEEKEKEKKKIIKLTKNSLL